MRLVLLSLAASLVAVTPAVANEARVEARGGVVWDSTDSEAVAGIALGYDWDLGETAFVGAEVSGDKLLTDGTKVAFGVSGRLGAKIAEAGKLYGVGGYATENCDLCEETWNLGAGYQHAFGPFYGKVEYRHVFVGNGFSDADMAVVGLGYRF